MKGREINFKFIFRTLKIHRIKILLSMFLFFLLCLTYNLPFSKPIYRSSGTLEFTETISSVYLPSIESSFFSPEIIDLSISKIAEEKIDYLPSRDEVIKSLKFPSVNTSKYLVINLESKKRNYLQPLLSQLFENALNEIHAKDKSLEELKIKSNPSLPKQITSYPARYILSIFSGFIFSLSFFVLYDYKVEMIFQINELNEYMKEQENGQVFSLEEFQDGIILFNKSMCYFSRSRYELIKMLKKESGVLFFIDEKLLKGKRISKLKNVTMGTLTDYFQFKNKVKHYDSVVFLSFSPLKSDNKLLFKEEKVGYLVIQNLTNLKDIERANKFFDEYSLTSLFVYPDKGRR